jgi:hypothetical protein
MQTGSLSELMDVLTGQEHSDRVHSKEKFALVFLRF